MAASISWPASQLPAASLMASHQIDQDLGLIRTPMDSGLARQRKRFGQPLPRVKVQWLMSNTQVALFKSWLAAKAAFGGAFFQIELPMDEAVDTYDARFAGTQVGYAKLGVDTWRVTAELEVKDRTPYSSEVVDVIIDIGSAALFQMQGDLDTAFLAPAFADWHAHFGA